MVTVSSIPRFHLAVPVDDLAAARRFYGEVLGLAQGRSADTWVDWNLYGHQFVTHLAPGRVERIHNSVDGHDVPVPHFGLLLQVAQFQELADRLRAAGTQFVIEPYLRFEGRPGSSGRCSSSIRREMPWSSKLSLTTPRSSPSETGRSVHFREQPSASAAGSPLGLGA